jgi:hypothetical protein
MSTLCYRTSPLKPSAQGNSCAAPARAAVRLFLGLLLAALLIPSAAFAATDIGKVISIVPGASVLRNGKTETLALHAGIRVSDAVRTDASGRVKILFNDDSTVSLGPESTLDMKEYADQGSKAAFTIHVPQGVVRAITGKIVDQNPEGFRITTPEAWVGIRGTIVSLRTSKGRTTVYVENTLRQVYVNNVHVPAGNKITLPGDPLRPEPIHPDDRRQLGRDLAFRGGAGVAAAAPEPAPAPARRPTEENFVAESPLPSDLTLRDSALATPALGDRMHLSPGTSLTGTVSGTLTASTVGSTLLGSPTFNFTVNLGSGAISGGTLSYQATFGLSSVFLSGGSISVPVSPGDPLSVNLTGGTGTATSAWFMMNSFAGGTVAVTTALTPIVGATAVVSGTHDLVNGPAGPLVGGVDYGVLDSVSSTMDQGIGTGTLTK